MIDRRVFFGGALASLPLASSRPAFGIQTCSPGGLPPGVCSALIDPTKFNGVAAEQEKSQWCWAACISMICRWYGYPIGQKTIVNGIYGGDINMPANDEKLTSALNNVWTSDDGRKFRISSETFSAALGTAAVSNEKVIDDLQNDRPLLNGSRTHATVVARVDYQPSSPPQVLRVHVIDPWPGAGTKSQLARFLDPDEMLAVQRGGSLRYLASVKVVPA